MIKICRRASIWSLIAWIISVSAPAADYDAVRMYQDRMRDLGRVRLSIGMQPNGPAWTGYENALNPLLTAPQNQILEGIRRSIRNGDLEEQIGALDVYINLMVRKKVKPDPELRLAIAELLKKDNLEIPAYTITLAGVLWNYPSTQTAVEIMDTAAREHDSRMRETLIGSTAAHMGLYLGVATNKPPAENARRVAEFEEWFQQNKDRIVIKEWGKFRLTGQESARKVMVLSEADRARIRANPDCVVRLKDVMLGADDQGKASQLLEQCGEALFGGETAALLKRVDEEDKSGKSPGLQLKAEINAAQASYPWRDAAILAAACVLAYEEDSAAREAAKETLFYCTPKDAKRVTEGEAPEIRKMAKDFAQGNGAPWSK
jgi:hypothetical protein